MSQPHSLFAACLPGLEPFLHAECAEIGLDATQVAGGVEFAGDDDVVRRACLWLGTASHVRIRLAQFRCRALGELQRKASEIPWRDWLMATVPLHLTARARHSRVYHTGGIRERIFEAIGATLRKPVSLVRTGEDGTPIESHVAIAVRFDGDECTISLDASEAPLHRRGYRLDGRKAPLREDIARALVLASGHVATEDALLDPFCGSGTIAIEAAGRALGLPPGRLLRAPLHRTPRSNIDRWEALCAERRPPSGTIQPIHASDRDRGAIEAVRANAERAGVLEAITATECAIAAHPWLQAGGAPERGVLVSNPPYGKRIGARSGKARGGKSGGKDPLLPLFQTLGAKLKVLGSGWRTALLTQDVRLARRTGAKLSAGFTTKHGGLNVTALRTDRSADGSKPGDPTGREERNPADTDAREPRVKQ
ncbi:MAG: class I SAM-dependent RNA methyltransferase [Planctomycetota bacterium]